jgi:hypothetical protein
LAVPRTFPPPARALTRAETVAISPAEDVRRSAAAQTRRDAMRALPELPLVVPAAMMDQPQAANPADARVDSRGTLTPIRAALAMSGNPPALQLSRDSRSSAPVGRSTTIQRAPGDPGPGPTTSDAPTVSATPPSDSGSPQPDLDQLARQVLAMIKRRLAIDRERLGLESERIGRVRGLRNW